ncbi:hypothetical protein MBORA_14260 [Methanobrevibacter oralis]|uniref:Uncharacterized protein n=1 Tax=Methanobrevibacter oralis TaxID=66851 RepID=A0A162FEK3_METOA|nr:hypothetical protein [Methanobrevibacter oralis]KZX11885.1 hypothetical protein MBORA_14260 [Methanobrevibacter oralis]
MDIRKIGLVLIFVGIALSVIFIDNHDYLVVALTITVLGLFLVVVGYIEEIKKAKLVNDKLNEDIPRIIQPLITKYSNLNKDYKIQFEDDEYKVKRIQLNQDLEKELTHNLPYLESRDIKKIVIDFNKEQDKMN